MFTVLMARDHHDNFQHTYNLYDLKLPYDNNQT